MSPGSIIDATENATIKCTGYINDVFPESDINEGKILVSGGSRMALPFILRDYKGGSYMLAAYNKNVSPFNQYQLLNIDSEVKIDSTSSVIGYANAYINDEVQSNEVKVVGPTTDYIYQLTEENSYVTMKVSSNGIADLDFYGGMNLNPLKMSVKILITVNITSENFHFPLHWSVNMSLNDGDYSFEGQDIKLLPGSSLIVASDASLVADDIVVYESFKDPCTVQPTLIYPAGKTSAMLNVNGTLECERLAGPAHSGTNGSKIKILNTGLSHMNSTETTGDISGLGGPLASIEVDTFEHTTKLYWGTGDNDYTTHTYTANTTVTYTKNSSGWTIS